MKPRRKLVLIATTAVAVIVLIVIIYAVLIPIHVFEKMKSYHIDFHDKVSKHGLRINASVFNTFTNMDQALALARGFVTKYVEMLGYNVVNVTVDEKYASPAYFVGLRTTIYSIGFKINNKYPAHVEVDSVKGRIIVFNVPPPPLDNCSFTKNFTRDRAKKIVVELLRELNYTVVDDPGVDVEVIELIPPYTPPSKIVKVVYTVKIYDFLDYNPIFTSRVNYVRVDLCTLKPVEFRINPLILTLYEYDVIKKPDIVVSEKEAHEKAIEYLKTLIASSGMSLEDYRVKNVTRVWYYADADNDGIIDTVSAGYLFTFYARTREVEHVFGVIPVSGEIHSLTYYIVVDVKTGVVSVAFGNVVIHEHRGMLSR